MVQFPLWKRIVVLLAVVLGFAYAVPNILPKDKVEAWQAKVPSFLPGKTVSLGLDLQGGSHLLLQVGVDVAIRDQADSLAAAARAELRSRKIPYTGLRPTAQGFNLTLREASDAADARRALRTLDTGLDFTDGLNAANIIVNFNDTRLREIRTQAIDQSIEIVRRRIDETGTREPIIARQGEDRIVLQLPGLDDPERVKNLLGQTAKLGFHLVDTDASMTGRTRTGIEMLPMIESPGQNLAVERRAIITGDMLDNAQPGFNQGQPVVTFRFNAIGTRRFCEATRANVNKPFAIVLDNQIVSAPVINEAICGGSGQISGNFTVQAATDLALLLRAGALPAPLEVVEERTVGPTLGSDSIDAGKKASLMALLFVIVYIIAAYGLFGVFASVALLINMVLLIALMSMLQATLTLPGIAGIVLVIGVAVDGNVLVYERIKEELREGRSIISAIDIGYQRALTTVTDANLTTLISALILFSFGTGPIKGFAVTTTIGVVTSYFCSMILTRLFILMWLRWTKPKHIAV